MSLMTREEIATLLDSCPKEHHVYFGGKALWVEWELPGGFTVGARAAMVDPTNFELEKGLAIARERAIDNLWQLEAYRESHPEEKTLKEVAQSARILASGQEREPYFEAEWKRLEQGIETLMSMTEK